MEYRFRTLSRDEEFKDERFIADKVMKIFVPALNVRDVELRFIVEHPYGEHIFDEPIAGFCRRNAKEIFVLSGRAYRDLILTACHELRHAFQFQTGRGGYDKE